jgi:hypothetical protein
MGIRVEELALEDDDLRRWAMSVSSRPSYRRRARSPSWVAACWLSAEASDSVEPDALHHHDVTVCQRAAGTTGGPLFYCDHPITRCVGPLVGSLRGKPARNTLAYGQT